jgi:hypothetical protein
MRARVRGARRIAVLATVAAAGCGVAAPQAAHAADRDASAVSTRAAAPHRALAPARPRGAALRAARARNRPIARAALCAASSLTGDWRNIDANTRSMRRAIVDFVCNDVRLCDTSGHCTGGDSSHYMHMFGACSPTSCDWGRVKAPDAGSGWIRSTYRFGFADVDVWLKTYQYYGLTYLRVYTSTRFAPGDGRANYTTDEWMLR